MGIQNFWKCQIHFRKMSIKKSLLFLFGVWQLQLQLSGKGQDARGMRHVLKSYSDRIWLNAIVGPALYTWTMKNQRLDSHGSEDTNTDTTETFCVQVSMQHADNEGYRSFVEWGEVRGQLGCWRWWRETSCRRWDLGNPYSLGRIDINKEKEKILQLVETTLAKSPG